MNMAEVAVGAGLPDMPPSGKVSPMSKLSLDRILQSQGFGTRKYCRSLIEEGDVAVDGAVHTNYKTVFEMDGLVLTVFDEAWPVRERVYLALYKPANFECSRKPSHHPGVLTLLPEQMSWREVQPVGRLDHDTTGLLLMSDDGPFIHAQSSPKRHVPKVYQATTAEPVTADLVALMLAGVQLHDEPAPLKAISCVQRSEFQLEIVLEQGKYHQVKRMLAAAGNHCVALHRSAIGQLQLDSLGIEEGEWCYLDNSQLALLV
jgi:16S rRNA pseudouridine516 synthase